MRSGAKILVVEPDPSRAAEINAALRTVFKGMFVSWVLTGNAAVEMLKTGTFDVVTVTKAVNQDEIAAQIRALCSRKGRVTQYLAVTEPRAFARALDEIRERSKAPLVRRPA